MAKYKLYILLLIGILFCYGIFLCLFPKYKNYYLIKDIDLIVVGCKVDSFGNINTMKLSLAFNKEFIAGKNSNRILFKGSMQEGLDGMFHKSLEMQVLLKKNTLTALGEYIKADSSGVTYHEMNAFPELYKNNYSLKQLIEDIKKNKKYTKDIGIYNQDLIFYLNLPEYIKIHKTDTILLSAKIDSTIIGKYLFVSNCLTFN
ncbi:MAG: hypothetical protein MUC49_12315 [Raineya sp.]|jgi:hypothetical protein|nr:hypothetical protein [Raineya sp.]